MITFYDIAARDPIKTLSANTWKTRFVLNYKKLPYKTVYLTFPDIPKEFTKLGIPSRGESANGPVYTCPSIIDHSNNTPVTESFDIALYLDKAYPDTPKALPPGTEALQAAFHEQFNKVMGPLWPFLLPKIPSLADIEPKGEERVKAWKQVQAAFDTLHGWLSKSPGPLEISFGESSQEWKDITTWNNGEWVALKKSLDKYANTDN